MDHNHPAFPAHLRKGEPLYVKRHQRKVARDAAMQSAYAHAETREGMKCQVTGAYLRKESVDPKLRLSHNHVTKRSRDRHQITDADNIMICSYTAHMLIEDGWLVVEGRNALKYRVHWNPATPPSLKIITIRSRRKSQREDEA